jgi:adenosylhomocysteine nucleosidase
MSTIQPSSWPADLALCFALPIEAEPFSDRLERRRKLEGDGFHVIYGDLAGRPLVAVITGPGRERARRAAAAILAAHRPKLVIVAGLAGGLVAGLPVCEVVRVTEVAGLESPARSLDWIWPDRPRVGHDGRLLTVDRVITDAAEKRALGERFGAIACDMETLAIVDACRQRNTAVAGIRVISDSVDESLPAGIGRLLNQATFAGKVGAALGMLARRPSRIKDLWKLQERAFLAADQLNGALLASLPHILAQLEAGRLPKQDAS